MPVTILLVDDHKIVRDGLRAMLIGQPHIQVMGEASNGREALDLLKHQQPDVLVLDIKLPQFSGLDIARS
ncbi:MAG TPA: response regulator transcription factor, partial [Phnomibacter sp.]|nr:response regulator transcription factor [Phnomibacter sp.]